MTSVTKRPGPRFGIWAIVYGTSASLQHPEDPVDASWKRNRDLVLEAEALGVARRIAAFHDAGIEIILLEFQPFGREMRRFAEEVRASAASLILPTVSHNS